MSDHPIPDELRDQFVTAFWAQSSLTKTQIRDLLKRLPHSARFELRLPEFAVHDDTCCGGAMFVCGQSGRSAACFRPRCENNRAPCPGVGYYHWTPRRDER